MLPRPYYTEQDLRKRQIDTLKVFNDNVTEVKENSEYSVEFVSNGKTMSLNVILTPEFPNEQPNIYINPPITHPWVAENTNQVTRAPGLVNFTVHSDLGRLVQAIIREFQKYLPSPEEGTSSDASPQNANYSGQPLMFPELAELTIDQLQEILKNPDLQDKLLENNSQLRELDREKEALMISIHQTAQEILANQPFVETIKSEVVERIAKLEDLKMKYEQLGRKHQELAARHEPGQIRDNLRAAAVKADEEAEILADNFLAGKVPVDEFLAQYTAKRALGQARRAKVEKFAHQLAQLDKATT